MYCRICGSTEGPNWFDGKWVELYPSKGWQALCKPCAKETPDKVTREQFEAKYWVNDSGQCEGDTIPLAIRKEFYSDYLASTDDLESYILATRTVSEY